MRCAALISILSALVAFTAPAGMAQTVLRVDARPQSGALEQGYFSMGTSTSPNGDEIGINNRYLTKEGHPWIPVMGEFHYTRVPSQDWDDEIIKMKSAGVNIISTYVIWTHHEPKPGDFNWSGDRDLRHFIDLCASHNMLVMLRIGPWAHGEVRYGGIPDWVVRQMPTRRTDPTYMSYVARYWGEIARQIKGDLFKDGGPIIGIQLENEYNLIGPGMGADHIAALKALARSLGMDAPFYTVTGWDGTTYPKGQVTPVFGGYPDEPWGLGTAKMAPNEVYNFRFNSRVAGNAGAQTPGVTKGTAIEDMPHTPFLGAEYAGGLPIMYRRRPLVAPDDIGAMLPVQLGSGVNLLGFYMFHGGQNPGQDLEENALLGGYNDLPILNYDFQAPYGEYGEAHPVLDVIRPYLLFLNAFGDRLAPMAVHAPMVEPKSRDDLSTPRLSVRSEGDRGFIFVNNYIRQYSMSAQAGVQFSVALPGTALTFPSHPITIRSGAYFIWPFNFDLDGVNLAWASAQPMTRIETGPTNVTYVFAAEEDIEPEFAISTAKAVQIEGVATTEAGGVRIFHPKPGLSIAATIKSEGKTISIVVLSSAQARQVWRGQFDGRDRLVITSGEVSFRKDSVELRSMADNHFSFGLYPALALTPQASLKLTPKPSKGIFQMFSAEAERKTITASISQIRPTDPAPPVTIGGKANQALQPYPESYGASGAWSISLPAGALDGLHDAFLSVDYQGDVARLFAGAEMLDDEFYYGPPWLVGLKRYKSNLSNPLTLTVMPLRRDAPIYLDDKIRSSLPDADQVARVNSVHVIPEYALEVGLPAAR